MSETSGESGSDQAALEVVDLHKSFGAVEVIRGVSMSAHKGDVISRDGQVSYNVANRCDCA